MTGPTHVAIAAAATLAYAAATGEGPTAAGWLAVIIGSLAPDIDAGGGTIARPGSLFGRILPRFVARLIDGIGLAVSGAIRAILGHRTLTHWPIWYILMIAAVPLIPASRPSSFILFWFAWGCLWHIAGDFCTKSGVPLLAPITTRDIKWSPLVTGTAPEYVLSAILWGVIAYYGWQYVPPEALAWFYRFRL